MEENKLTVFEFEHQNVECITLNDEPLFNPYDVGNCLGLKETSIRDHLSEMDNDEKILLKNPNVGSNDIRNLANRGEYFLKESGLYLLIFKSRKPEAKKFVKWVTKEVLPSIRETGKYQNRIGNDAKKLLNSVIIEYASDKLDTRQLIYILSFLFSKEGHGSIGKIYDEIDQKIYEKTMFDMDCITERRNCKRKDVFNRKKDLANTGLLSLIELYEPGLLDQVTDLIMDPCQKSLVAFKEGV